MNDDVAPLARSIFLNRLLEVEGRATPVIVRGLAVTAIKDAQLFEESLEFMRAAGELVNEARDVVLEVEDGDIQE